MARARRKPARRSGTFYAWSDLYNGGESTELKTGRKIIHSRNIIARGDEVTQADLDVDDDYWDHLVKTGSVRDYPFPEGYNQDIGMSPVTFVLEEHRRKLEEAELSAEAESAEDILLRASVVGTQIFGPAPEEVLMGVALPEGVEEPTEET